MLIVRILFIFNLSFLVFSSLDAVNTSSSSADASDKNEKSNVFSNSTPLNISSSTDNSDVMKIENWPSLEIFGNAEMPMGRTETPDEDVVLIGYVEGKDSELMAQMIKQLREEWRSPVKTSTRSQTSTDGDFQIKRLKFGDENNSNHTRNVNGFGGTQSDLLTPEEEILQSSPYSSSQLSCFSQRPFSQELSTQTSQQITTTFVHNFSNNGEVLEYASAPGAFGGDFVSPYSALEKERPATCDLPYNGSVGYSVASGTEYNPSGPSAEHQTFFHSPLSCSPTPGASQDSPVSLPTTANFSNNGEVLGYASSPGGFGGLGIGIYSQLEEGPPATYALPDHESVVYSATSGTEYNSSGPSAEPQTFFHSSLPSSPALFSEQNSPASLPTTVIDGQDDDEEYSQYSGILWSKEDPEDALRTPPPTPYTPTQVLGESQRTKSASSSTVKKRKRIEIEDKENVNPNNSQPMRKPGPKLSGDVLRRIKGVEERMKAYDKAKKKVSVGRAQFWVPARGTQGNAPKKLREANLQGKDPKNPQTTAPTPYTPTQVLGGSQRTKSVDSSAVNKRKRMEFESKENVNPNVSQPMRKPGPKISGEILMRAQAVQERMDAHGKAKKKVSVGRAQFWVPARGTQGNAPKKLREAKPITIRNLKLPLNPIDVPDEIIEW